MIKCVIIDDEPLARECISNYISTVEFLKLVGLGENPIELSNLLDRNQVDLIFLDIEMPIMSGIEYLKMAKNPPMVIIASAYPNFAIDGFQLNVIDYMLKPITFNRFFQGACKAKDYHNLKINSLHSSNSGHSNRENFFFVKCDYKYERIYFNDILFIEGMQNYVTIYTLKGKYVTLLSLKCVEDNLDENLFLRIHKSYIVAIDKIESIDTNEVTINSTQIPVGRNFKEVVVEKIINDRLWRKSGE